MAILWAQPNKPGASETRTNRLIWGSSLDTFLWIFFRNHLLDYLLEHPTFSDIWEEGTSLNQLLINMIDS
jgi:hypothetical protein